MSDPHQAEDAREADDMGEKPDLGRQPDAMAEAVNGSDMGSDTRAGSLEGGASTGSERDVDQDGINQSLASEGMAAPGEFTGPAGDPVEGKPDQPTSDDDAQAPTG
jgi:hypothetical protein